MAHHRKRDKKLDNETKEEEDEEDPFDLRIKQSGCAEFHFALQECFHETQDWRKCQNQMKNFRECMANQEKNKGAKT